MPLTPMKPEKAKYPKPRYNIHDIISLCKINHKFSFLFDFRNPHESTFFSTLTSKGGKYAKNKCAVATVTLLTHYINTGIVCAFNYILKSCKVRHFCA